MSDRRESIPEDTQDTGQLVMVQWDNLDLWEATVEDTGTGWEAHFFRDFDEFYLTSLDDVV